MRWNPDPVARWSLTPLIGFFLLFALALSPVAAQQNEPAGAVSTDDRATTSRSVVLAGQLLQNTLYDALVAEKIPPAEIINLAKAFKPVFDFRFARPGHRYELQLNGNRQIQTFVYKAGVVEEYEAVKTDSGGYRVVKRSVELDRQVAAKVFTIKTSLCQAIEEKGERQTLAGLIAELFAWDIDFYLYPRKGDRIAVVFERCYKDGRFVRYGKILAARYVGSQSTFSAFFFSDGTLKG